MFISWSGAKSKAVGSALNEWLPKAVQVEPFMSASDIAAGERWLPEINAQLEGTQFGIVCVTKDNQFAPWINFEAGAIGKLVGESAVAPLAIDLSVSDVKQPLGQFQVKTMDKEGITDILRALNERCDDPIKDVEEAVDV